MCTTAATSHTSHTVYWCATLWQWFCVFVCPSAGYRLMPIQIWMSKKTLCSRYWKKDKCNLRLAAVPGPHDNKSKRLKVSVFPQGAGLVTDWKRSRGSSQGLKKMVIAEFCSVNYRYPGEHGEQRGDWEKWEIRRLSLSLGSRDTDGLSCRELWLRMLMPKRKRKREALQEVDFDHSLREKNVRTKKKWRENRSGNWRILFLFFLG